MCPVDPLSPLSPAAFDDRSDFSLQKMLKPEGNSSSFKSQAVPQPCSPLWGEQSQLLYQAPEVYFIRLTSGLTHSAAHEVSLFQAQK